MDQDCETTPLSCALNRIADALAQPTDIWNSAQPTVLVALIGIVGLLLAAWLASRSALRVRLIDLAVADEREAAAYHVRTIAAVNELGIVTALVYAAYRDSIKAAVLAAREEAKTSGNEAALHAPLAIALKPALESRNAAATTAWRTALAEGHYYANPELSQVLQAYDRQRAVVVDALNEINDPAGLEKVERELELWREHYGRQLYRHLQIAKIHGRFGIAHLAQVRRLRGWAKDWRTALLGESNKGGQLIDEADAKFESGPTESQTPSSPTPSVPTS